MKDINSTEIKKSAIEGMAVFAARNFEKGEVVYSFKKGKIINAIDVQDMLKDEKRYLDKIGDNEFEIIEPPGRYVNHSCEPNVVEKKRVAYALRDIKKGEEITIDYDQIAYLETPFKCNCSSKNCRGLICGKQ